jgi:uncharacterized protein with FMN-binding domain
MIVHKRLASATAGIAAASAFAGCGASDAATTQPTSTSEARTRARSAPTSTSRYADGVCRARGWYGSLPSSITVVVTLTDGVIKAVRVRPHATNPTSLQLQRRFAAAVPAVVVGKRIDTVKVGRLAGSSGTPVGFNDAIDRIKRQARAAASASR